MGAIAKTRLLPDTSLTGVNRLVTPATLTKNKIVGRGTPTGSEVALESLDVAGVDKALGVIQEDVEAGKSVTVFGPGSIVAVESDGSDTIAPDAEVIAVAGASLAASGRMKTLPGSAGTYYVVGRYIGHATLAATAGLTGLVRLVETRKVIVA